MGDLNDGVDAATTQILLGPGGSEIGTAAQWTPDQGDAWRLWNLAPLIAEDHRYSRVYRGRRELIDHVLISRALMDHVTTVDSWVTSPEQRTLPSMTDRPSTGTAVHASDHAPVVATFDIG
jgi:predicted extracellular nuclease